MSHLDDELTISLRLTAESVDFSLETELNGIWTSSLDEFTLGPDSLSLWIAEVVFPTVFPYARASLVTTASSLGFNIPPLRAFSPEQIDTVDAETLLNSKPSLTLRKRTEPRTQ